MSDVIIDMEHSAELFFIDDVVSCSDGHDYRITAIDDEGFLFATDASPSTEYRVSYQDLSAAQLVSGEPQPDGEAALPACVAAEYLRRAEQARRDDEVDALWRSAMVCRL